MNIYFLVEGNETEPQVYPKWLHYLLPSLKRVKEAHQVTYNNYVLISGGGFPALLSTPYENSVKDINEIGSFDYLVIIVDTEKYSTDSRREIIERFIKNKAIQLTNRTELIIILQKRCIETWFLGNREIYSDTPKQKKTKDYCSWYNVKELDPELMHSYDTKLSIGKFHKQYLKQLFKEQNLFYSEKSPNHIIEKHYLDELINRQEETNHLQSFKTFIDFCQTVQQQMQTTDQD
ncbi:MAG: hypothetical protein ACK6DA_10840 [Candidatus Kapaibacterium sp.]